MWFEVFCHTLNVFAVVAGISGGVYSVIRVIVQRDIACNPARLEHAKEMRLIEEREAIAARKTEERWLNERNPQ